MSKGYDAAGGEQIAGACNLRGLSQGESAEVLLLLYVAEGRESISHLYQGKCLLDINQLSPSY
jgi:hypothetical protein